MRRRMMMSAKEEEPIVWDYEWYPPEEKPAWFTISNSNVSYEMGDTYFRIHCANTPSNVMNRLLWDFLSSEFPTTQSYLVEIDMTELATRQGFSTQSGLCYTKRTAVDGIWLKRNGNTKISGTNYYTERFASSDNGTDGPVITNNLRYKLRLLYDNNNSIFRASVNDKTFSMSATGIAPRRVYSRYTNNGYVDIYSVKIKVINNE